MAHVVPLHLTVAVDNTSAVELTHRVGSVVYHCLGRSLAGLPVSVEGITDWTASAVMVEILRVRQSNPAEMGAARVRELHRNEYESCTECTHEMAVPWPCPTIRALNGQEQS